MRQQADTAARSATELAALYSLSQGISAEVELDRILPLVARTTTYAAPCAILLRADLQRRGAPGRARDCAGEPRPSPRGASMPFCGSASRVLGVLRVTQRSLQEVLTAEEQERLQTIAAQVVLVIERARLVEEASQARAQAASERIKATAARRCRTICARRWR